jgi:hypothetical protein
MRAVILALVVISPAYAESTAGIIFKAPGSTFQFRGVECKLPAKNGVIASVVERRGPGYKAALRESDFITHINGNTIKGVDDLNSTVAKTTAGEILNLTYQRPSLRAKRVTWQSRETRLRPIDKEDFLRQVVIEETLPDGSIVFRYYKDEPWSSPSTELEVGLRQWKEYETDKWFLEIKATYIGKSQLMPTSVIFVTAADRKGEGPKDVIKDDRFTIDPKGWNHERRRSNFVDWCYSHQLTAGYIPVRWLAEFKPVQIVFQGKTSFYERDATPNEMYKSWVMMQYQHHILKQRPDRP